MEIINNGKKYYPDWKQSIYLIELPQKRRDEAKINFAIRLAAYYGLTGANAEEIGMIPNLTSSFFSKFTQIKLFDFDIVFNDFKKDPPLKKISADYVVSIFDKYMNSETRKQIMEFHRLDDTKLLTAKSENIDSAIDSLSWMFGEYKKRGSFPYTLLGINQDHKPFLTLLQAGVFWDELEAEDLLTEAYRDKLIEIQDQIETIKGKEITLDNKNLITACEDRIKVLNRGHIDFITTKKPNAQLRNISRIYRITKTFEQYKFADVDEFKEQIKLITEEVKQEN